MLANTRRDRTWLRDSKAGAQGKGKKAQRAKGAGWGALLGLPRAAPDLPRVFFARLECAVETTSSVLSAGSPPPSPRAPLPSHRQPDPTT